MGADKKEKTFTADPSNWVNYEGYDLHVDKGSVTLNTETGVVRCGEHFLELLVDAVTGVRTCPNCATQAVIQLASIA